MTPRQKLHETFDRMAATALRIKAERDALAARCERLEEALVCTEYALANPASSDQEFALAAAHAALADKAKP